MFDDAMKFEIKIKGYNECKYYTYADSVEAAAQRVGYFVFNEQGYCKYFPIHMVECVLIGVIDELH